MPSVQLEDLTPFGRLALQLDREFAELSDVADQLSGLNIASDGDLDQGAKLLERAAKKGQSIAESMQEFANSLQEAREKSEAATKIIAERAQLIQQRRQQEDKLQEQLTQVKEAVRTIGAGLTNFSAPPASGALSDEEKSQIAAELERLQAPMSRFIEAVQAIKAEAAHSKFRRLERQADSIIDSLQAARRKIAQVLPPK